MAASNTKVPAIALKSPVNSGTIPIFFWVDVVLFLLVGHLDDTSEPAAVYASFVDRKVRFESTGLRATYYFS